MIKRKKPLILFKYGGNAMTDDELKKQVLEHMCSLTKKGYHVVIVHGGGPFIKDILGKVGVESEFIDGHRKTTPEALKYVEMALKGEVNGSLVSLVNRLGYKAVGLSGKDGKMAIATKRLHRKMVDGKWKSFDLGQVGDVKHINPQLPEYLLNEGYIPVVTCIASDEDGNDYNINADMFAGHLAGALHAEQYIVLTDVDGLRMDKDKPETLIDKLHVAEIPSLVEDGVIQGGMLPKMDACRIALADGAGSARIINGTQPEQISDLIGKNPVGTTIIK